MFWFPDANLYPILGLGKFDCIAQQIDQNLLTTHFINLNTHFSHWQVRSQLNGDVLSERLCGENFDDRFDNITFKCLLRGARLQFLLVEKAHI